MQLNSFEKVSKKFGFTTNAIKVKPWLPFVYYIHAPVKGAIAHTFSWFGDGYTAFRNAIYLFHKTLAKIKSRKLITLHIRTKKSAAHLKMCLWHLQTLLCFVNVSVRDFDITPFFQIFNVLRNNWIILNVTGFFHPFSLFTHIELVTQIKLKHNLWLP